MREINQIFEGVEDPRRSNATRHDLCEMPAIGLLCIMCEGEGCVDMARFGRSKLEFPRRFMTLEHGVPSRDAFSDLFNALDPGGLRDALPEPAFGRGERLKDDAVAVDCKALRRSFKDAASRSPLHLVHAFAAQSRLVVGQVRVDAKSNETAAMPKLLELLDAEGRIICGRRDAHAALRGRGGRATRRRLRSGAGGQQGEAARRGPLPFRGSRQRGKVAALQVTWTRTAAASSCARQRFATMPKHFRICTAGRGWEAVGKAKATREVKGERETGTRFFLPGSKMTPERFHGAVLAHRAVESSLAWC